MRCSRPERRGRSSVTVSRLRPSGAASGSWRGCCSATLLVALAIGLAVGGGAFLWFHQSVSAVHAHSAEVKIAQKQLDVTLPGQAAIALVVGYDHRAGDGSRTSRARTR